MILLNKISLLCLLFFSFQFGTFAQDFAPVGSTWHYTNIESFFSSDKGYVKIESVKDTVIQTKTCKKLVTALYRSYGSIIYGDTAFVYTDGDVVYKLADNDLFYVLYNFGSEVGDKWTTRASNHFTGEEVEAEMEVTQVSTVTINGKSLRKLTLSSNNTYASYYQIIETLGGTRYMFPQDYALSDMDIIMPLRCYQDSDFGQYTLEGTTDCALITATQESTDELGVKVFPNPVEENVTIQLPSEYSKLELLLYTSQGALLKSQELTNMSTASLTLTQKGVYFIHLKVEGKAPIIKKVVKL